jgi:hypothetical protein
VISIALVKIDNFASRLSSVLSAEFALGEELEGPGFAMDGQCIERDMGVQITAHQLNNSAKASCWSSNEWIWQILQSNVINKTQHGGAINEMRTHCLTFERSLDKETGDHLPTYRHKKFKRSVYSIVIGSSCFRTHDQAG